MSADPVGKVRRKPLRVVEQCRFDEDTQACVLIRDLGQFQLKLAIDGLFDAASRVFPALRGSPLTMKWAGLRPVTPDGNPLVGRDPAVPNLYYATGHGRAGIMLGSLTGELVRDLVIGTEIEYDLSPMDPQRFWQS